MNILLAQLIVVFLCNTEHMNESKYRRFVKVTEPYFNKEDITERELEYLSREYKKIRNEDDLIKHRDLKMTPSNVEVIL